MKHWEEAAILTDLLDRHVRRLTAETSPTDWTIYWALTPFLHFLEREPILASFLGDYVNEVVTVLDHQKKSAGGLVRDVTELYRDQEETLLKVRELISLEEWEVNGIPIAVIECKSPTLGEGWPVSARRAPGERGPASPSTSAKATTASSRSSWENTPCRTSQWRSP